MLFTGADIADKAVLSTDDQVGKMGDGLSCRMDATHIILSTNTSGHASSVRGKHSDGGYKTDEGGPSVSMYSAMTKVMWTTAARLPSNWHNS